MAWIATFKPHDENLAQDTRVEFKERPRWSCDKGDVTVWGREDEPVLLASLDKGSVVIENHPQTGEEQPNG